MRRIFTLISVIILSTSFSVASIASNSNPPEKVKMTKEEKALLKEQQAEQKKADKKAEQEAKRAARLADAPTFEEFMLEYEPVKICGVESVDLFCAQAETMLMSYKTINDSINFIKIEVVQIPDAGDGVTSEVKITDGNGNPRTQKATNLKWAEISARFALFGVDCALLVVSGASAVVDLSLDPTNLLNGSIKQLKKSMAALKMLTIEIDRTTPILSQQRELLKSVEEN